MRLRVTSRGTDLKPDLKAFVERRVHFALGRFAGRVKAVSVRLAGVDLSDLISEGSLEPAD